MPDTYYPVQELLKAKADSWLESAKSQTKEWVDSFGYGNQPKPAPAQEQPALDIKLPTAEEWHAAAPWRDLDPPKPDPIAASAQSVAPQPSASRTAPAAPTSGGAAPQGQQQGGQTAPLAAVDTSSREANLRSWAPALQAAERRGFKADALAAIIIAENGGGQSDLSRNDNNYFSISAVGRPHQAGAGTGGRFARYNTPQDSLEDFLDLIERDPRYAKAYAARGNPDQFFRELINAGYIAEEPGFPVAKWLENLHDGRQQYQRIVPPGATVAAPQPGAPQGQQQQDGQQGYHPIVRNAAADSYWTDQGTHGGAPAADIFAPRGEPIYAPVGGTVEVLNVPRGGHAAILRGDDGRYYYMAHGNVPFRGGRVESGQQIGEVGDSGNARGGRPHVHFAIATDPSVFTRANGSGDIPGDSTYYVVPQQQPAGRQSSVPPQAEQPVANAAPSSLPAGVAARWRQQFGREPSPEEAAELMGVVGGFA